MPAPGFGREGRRGLQESKPFLSELNKIFHTVRAQHSERRNAASAAAAQSNETSQAATVMDIKGKARKPREFTDKAAWKAHMKAMRQTHKQRRNNKKKSSLSAGGSIWITLKGGFAAHNVPQQHNHRKQIQQAAEARVKLSVQRRKAALELAEAYVQSAWEQAREAGLITSTNNITNTNDNNSKAQSAIAALVPANGVSEDGAQYLQEQYAVAATHLVIPDTNESTSAEIVGSHMRQLIAAHSEAAAVAAKQPSTTRKSAQHQTANEEEEESEEQSGLNVPSEPTVLSREEWADLLLREYLITHAVFTKEGLADAQAAVQEEMQTMSNPEAVYYIAVVEPCVSDNKERTARQAQFDAPQNGLDEAGNMETIAECAEDIVPTKCIVHACNSQRQKATTILSKTKEINIFVSNFMQAVRKELGSSCLPRGPVETTETNATSTNTTVVSGGHATPSPAVNRNANSNSSTNNASHGGKSNTRRKRR